MFILLCTFTFKQIADQYFKKTFPSKECMLLAGKRLIIEIK